MVKLIEITQGFLEYLATCTVDLNPADYDVVSRIKLRDLKRGEFFKTIPNSHKVWVKGAYYPAEKKWYCSNHIDISSDRLLSGDKLVYINFTY